MEVLVTEARLRLCYCIFEIDMYLLSCFCDWLSLKCFWPYTLVWRRALKSLGDAGFCSSIIPL